MTATMLLDASGERRRMLRAETFGNPTAPLPLRRREAIEVAGELRRAGLAWQAVAVVMEHYHGWPLTCYGWRCSVLKWCEFEVAA